MRPAERFWKKVDKTPGHGPQGECWRWTAAQTNDGYGCFRFEGRLIMAHRIAWRMTHSDPRQLKVCHKCDTPGCVNPSHLFLGTQFENMQDMVAKGRQNKAYGVGHSQNKLTEARVLAIYRDSRIQREIAADHDVERTTVYHIKSGRNWSHLTGHARKERR